MSDPRLVSIDFEKLILLLNKGKLFDPYTPYGRISDEVIYES